jgi:sugar phosphate isomerase/epimerase
MTFAGRQEVPAVALSTASVFPQSLSAAFAYAAELGYDGVELMVWTDRVSQDPARVERLSREFGVPVVAVHAPCLLLTQRVWDPDPLVRMHRAAEVAERLGASTVVVHPPFRWQRRYVARFADEIDDAEQRLGIRMAVENMFPLQKGRIYARPYAPGYDPTDVGYRHYTLDLSHTAASGQDALELCEGMGPGLVHLHLADGSGRPRDEHLIPGRGGQPCAEVCRWLGSTGFSGAVVLEVSTRRCRSRDERAGQLAEALQFARRHLRPPVTAEPPESPSEPPSEDRSAAYGVLPPPPSG